MKAKIYSLSIALMVLLVSSPLLATPKDTVLIAQGTDPTTLDPQDHFEMPAFCVLINIYETLLVRSDDMKIQPLLATSWKIINDTTWEFSLRKGVKFHNGEDFNAAAVKFSLERVIREAGPSTGLSPSGLLLEPVVELIRGAIDDVRSVTAELRPSIIDDLGIMATVSWFCRNCEKAHGTIRLEKELALEAQIGAAVEIREAEEDRRGDADVAAEPPHEEPGREEDGAENQEVRDTEAEVAVAEETPEDQVREQDPRSVDVEDLAVRDAPEVIHEVGDIEHDRRVVGHPPSQGECRDEEEKGAEQGEDHGERPAAHRGAPAGGSGGRRIWRSSSRERDFSARAGSASRRRSWRRLFSRMMASIRSSSVPFAISRKTWTPRPCPILWTLPVAWSSRAAFHHRS